MQIILSKISDLKEKICTVYLIQDLTDLSGLEMGNDKLNYLTGKLEKENDCVIYSYPNLCFFSKFPAPIISNFVFEQARKSGSRLQKIIRDEKIKIIQLINHADQKVLVSFTEGLLLSNYSFSKYKKEKTESFPEELWIDEPVISEENLTEIQQVIKAVHWARDLVNEPLSYLTAVKFSEEMAELAEESGFSIEIFSKQKIRSLKMGGLLAVNRGSPDPPTFSILEWKPGDAVNQKPIIFVGKGIVYDTGGLSLKPTLKSMDYMKSDMAGAAAVAGTVYAVSRLKMPLWIIGLIPATDNRPDGNALVPGDIITMFDGTTVEVRNTDAEGRLILADALAYARKYDPELVIDIATLTGSAEMIAGKHAMVGMGNSPEYMTLLKEAGDQTWERIIELPLWSEYAEPLKSTIADLNNTGSREGQAIVAGKFLEHFTDYKWIHLDMAGTSFYYEKEDYCPDGGTGTGIRLLVSFLKKMILSSNHG